jgi:integrase
MPFESLNFMAPSNRRAGVPANTPRRLPRLPELVGPVGPGGTLLELVAQYRQRNLLQAHPSVLSRYLRSVVALAEFLQRPALVADLAEENLLGVERSKRASNASKAAVIEVGKHLNRLWRFAVEEQILPGGPEPARKQLPRLPELVASIHPEMPLLQLVAEYRERKLIRAHPKVLCRYLRSVVALEEFLKRPALVADLAEDNLLGVEQNKRASNASEATVKEYRRHLQQLWNFAFRRGILPTGPDLAPLRTPRRTPFAWNRDQLGKLFAAVDLSAYEFRGKTTRRIPFRVWLRGLLLVMWDTAERLGACLKLEWRHLDRSSGWIHIPAEVRKWQSGDLSFQLHPDTLATLENLRSVVDHAPTDRLFPWAMSAEYLWKKYREILEAAGLPAGRKQMFHAMRRSVASHLEGAGVDSGRVLGHADRETTRAYISPAIVEPPPPSAVLPRPF